MTQTAHDTIPDDRRLYLYLSERYLQELEIALRLTGVPARYERPGAQGVLLPRLCVCIPSTAR